MAKKNKCRCVQCLIDMCKIKLYCCEVTRKIRVLNAASSGNGTKITSSPRKRTLEIKQKLYFGADGLQLWMNEDGWIVVKFCADIHGLQRMNPDSFGDPLTFPP